jgi:ATP-dependent DNA helicase RecQ
MKPNWGFADLWKNHLFRSKLLNIIFDEGHCVSKWAGFRQDYKQVERLRYLIPSNVRYYVVSATFPAPVLRDVMDGLQIRHKNLHSVHRSNNRPNIALTVREMVHPANSFLDLAFLVPDNPPPDWRPPKFLIFFDDIADSVRAARFLKSRLPLHLRERIQWFNSEMSPEFREQSCEDLKEGRMWGLFCTDSFGMVSRSAWRDPRKC